MRIRSKNSIALTTGLCALALVGIVPAQTSNTFEVVSIKPNRTGEQNTQIVPAGGRLSITNATVKTLIRNAYDVLDFQLTGGPNWLDTEPYDIQAKTNGLETITPQLMKPLLQHLLSDRFELKVHWQAREMPVYALLLDKNGPKFKQSTSDGKPGMNTRKPQGLVQMTGTNVAIEELASNLGFQLKRIVVDRTGLTGAYDFVLRFGTDQVADSTEPSLFSALREQLGLKLESGKGPVNVLVIDGVQKPSEN